MLFIFFFCVQFSQAGSVVYVSVHLNDECRTLNRYRLAYMYCQAKLTLSTTANFVEGESQLEKW